MADVTLAQVGAVLALICGIAGSLEFIYSRFKKWFEGLMKRELDPVRESIAREHRSLVEIDVAQSKNFLVRCFNDIEEGRKLNRETVLRMYEVYDRYTNDLHQNSYIHERMEQIEKEGKL